jgi:hypothetical protein
MRLTSLVARECTAPAGGGFRVCLKVRSLDRSLRVCEKLLRTLLVTTGRKSAFALGLAAPRMRSDKGNLYLFALRVLKGRF